MNSTCEYFAHLAFIFRSFFCIFISVQPRSNVANIKEKKSISPELAARLQRMEGAHANGLENLPFFGLAVLAGNWAGIDNKTLNIVSGSYLLWRIAYNYVYFNQSSRRTAGLRSLIWLTSMFFPFYLFFKAASLAGQRSLV
ncbi:hypothetical protein CVT26_002913 [Gymnopilus dilepis]|uniref:Uncharacterized protein n=1 Tax=Gymnopilus dilepis TaxID=231916 RepID=A0A409W2H1_9AGAR|nr:hypothetical protein CVT26_002913 [Gymnopilus dilepis]